MSAIHKPRWYKPTPHSRPFNEQLGRILQVHFCSDFDSVLDLPPLELNSSHLQYLYGLRDGLNYSGTGSISAKSVSDMIQDIHEAEKIVVEL